jgi:hypothetical protein
MATSASDPAVEAMLDQHVPELAQPDRTDPVQGGQLPLRHHGHGHGHGHERGESPLRLRVGPVPGLSAYNNLPRPFMLLGIKSILYARRDSTLAFRSVVRTLTPPWPE